MSGLSTLEVEVIQLVARENWPGFRTDALRLVKRENTGAGRYTYIEDGHNQPLPDGSYSAQGRMVQLAGLRSGLGFVVDVSSSRIAHIEMFTFGEEEWNGNESEWRIA